MWLENNREHEHIFKLMEDISMQAYNVAQHFRLEVEDEDDWHYHQLTSIILGNNKVRLGIIQPGNTQDNMEVKVEFNNKPYFNYEGKMPQPNQTPMFLKKIKDAIYKAVLDMHKVEGKEFRLPPSDRNQGIN